MDKRPISELLETTMQKVREMIDANTIIGEPVTTIDGITLIPISKITFGLAGGGTDFAKKNEPEGGFGGGIGAGVNIIPVAFIIAKGDGVKLMNLSQPPASTVDKIIEAVPEILGKVSEIFANDANDKEAE